MARGPQRWTEVTRSVFTHEAEGLGLIRALLPPRDPFRAWSNFEFRDGHGKWHEVDLLVVGQRRLHLVELKYYSGSLRGDDITWRREGRRAEDSPLKLARRKAQRLASKLHDELNAWAQETGAQVPDTRTVVPYVQECVFLHHPDLACLLPPASRIDLFGRDDRQAATGLPGISGRLLEPASLCDRLGLPPGARLFHKRPLDSALPGHAISGDIESALADVTGQPLVTCVLNAIDDALDRSDPGGTQWTAAAIRHLRPLLDRARYAGRTVVLTSDHGHVIERRAGRQRPQAEASSGRSRSAAEPATDGEVLMAGARVLLHGGRAVLAVDEGLRYGPLKAGYHGGASPAEVIVPVAVLVPGGVPEGTGLRLAPPQEPPWWIDPVDVPVLASRPSRRRGPAESAGGIAGLRKSLSTGQRPDRLRGTPESAATLFDFNDMVPEPPAARRAEPAEAETTGARPAARQASPAHALAATVVGSAQYAAQRKIAGRLSVPDDRVRELLAALLAAPSGRIGPEAAAAALAVSPVVLRGAILHVQRLLNVEGYPVLRVDADGATVILDEPLLREQFGVRA